MQLIGVILDNLAKPKRKTKPSEVPLIWQSKYEFVVPYNMDECIRRINALGDKYWNERQGLWRLFFPLENFGIDSQEDNGAVFNFRMRGRAYKGALEAELIGSLIYETGQQTRIKVKSGFTRSSIIIIIMMLLIMNMIFLLATHASNSFEILVALACSFVFFSLIALPDLVFGYPLKTILYDDLRKALSAPKVSRPQTLPP